MPTLKEKLIEEYLTPQTKKWARIADSLAAGFSFVCALLALYNLYFVVPNQTSVLTFKLCAWVYLIASPGLFALLYRETNLRKIERHALVFFILISSSCLLMAIMVLSRV